MTGDTLAVDVAEAARLLSWTETGVWQAIRDGKLTSFKLGRRRLISRAALAAFVQRRELLDSRPVGPTRESVVPFPALETTTTLAASSAAGRTRSAKAKRKAV